MMRLVEILSSEEMPTFPEEDQKLVMHVELDILDGKHIFRGTDSLECLGMQVKFHNNIYINLELDSREDTEKYSKPSPWTAKSPWNCKTCSGRTTSLIVSTVSGYNGYLVAREKPPK